MTQPAFLNDNTDIQQPHMMHSLPYCPASWLKRETLHVWLLQRKKACKVRCTHTHTHANIYIYIYTLIYTYIHTETFKQNPLQPVYCNSHRRRDVSKRPAQANPLTRSNTPLRAERLCKNTQMLEKNSSPSSPMLPPQSLSPYPPASARTALVRNKRPVVEGPSTGQVFLGSTAGTLKS